MQTIVEEPDARGTLPTQHPSPRKQNGNFKITFYNSSDAKPTSGNSAVRANLALPETSQTKNTHEARGRIVYTPIYKCAQVVWDLKNSAIDRCLVYNETTYLELFNTLLVHIQRRVFSDLNIIHSFRVAYKSSLVLGSWLIDGQGHLSGVPNKGDKKTEHDSNTKPMLEGPLSADAAADDYKPPANFDPPVLIFGGKKDKKFVFGQIVLSMLNESFTLVPHIDPLILKTFFQTAAATETEYQPANNLSECRLINDMPLAVDEQMGGVAEQKRCRVCLDVKCKAQQCCSKLKRQRNDSLSESTTSSDDDPESERGETHFNGKTPPCKATKERATLLSRKVNSTRRPYSNAGSRRRLPVNQNETKEEYTSAAEHSSITRSPASSVYENDDDDYYNDDDDDDDVECFDDGGSINDGSLTLLSVRSDEKSNTHRRKKRARNSLHIAYGSEEESCMTNNISTVNSVVSDNNRDSMSMSMSQGSGENHWQRTEGVSPRKPPSSIGSSLVNRFRDIAINSNLCRELVREYYTGSSANHSRLENKLRGWMNDNSIDRRYLEEIFALEQETINRNDTETFEDLVRKAELGDIRYMLTLFLFLLRGNRSAAGQKTQVVQDQDTPMEE